MDKISIIAGDGTLPVVLAKRLVDTGSLSLIIVLQGAADRFKGIPVNIFENPPGKVGRSLNALLKNSINKVIMIGKIDKNGFIERRGLDLKALSLIRKLKDGTDMSIFHVIAGEFKKAGIEVMPQDEYLQDMIAVKGVITKRKPSKDEMSCVIFGMDHARKIATMDIGQTVIVKNQIVTAVEAAEGTDETIRRGAAVSGKNYIICKAARANQDRRFDLPGIGMDTLQLMAETGCSVLALEAGKILVADIENVIKYANKNNISIVGI